METPRLAGAVLHGATGLPSTTGGALSREIHPAIFRESPFEALSVANEKSPLMAS